MMAAIPGAVTASTYGHPEHQLKVELSVNPAGKIDECTIIAPSDYPEQDSVACAILQRRGSASLDRARPSKLRTVTRWIGNSADSDILIQPDDPKLKIAPREGSSWLNVDDYPDELLHGASVATTVFFTVSPNGRAVNCRGDGKSGYRAVESWSCHIVESRRLFAQGQTPQGQPSSYDSSVRFFWTPRAIRACDFQDECWKLKEWSPPADAGKAQ
jgi:hypothetical protein